MSSYRESELTRLVMQTRNHLWLESALRNIKISLYISAALVIMAAASHLFSAWSNPYSTGSALVLLPPLLAIFYCLLLQRPSMKAASYAADKRVDANSLILSAWDLMQHSSNSSATSQLVVKQAMSKASNWQAQIKTRLTLELPPSSALAITVILIGITMLSLPGGTQHLQAQPNTQFTRSHQAKPANPLTDIIRSFDQPPQPTTNTLASSTANFASQNSAQKNAALSKTTQERENQNSILSTDQNSMDGKPPVTLPSNSSGHPLKTEGQQHDIAGNSKAIVDTKQSHSESSALNVTTVPIKRRANTDGSHYSNSPQGTTVTGFDQPAIIDRRVHKVAAARVEKSLHYSGGFTASQQQFIAQYFQQLHRGEKSDSN